MGNRELDSWIGLHLFEISDTCKGKTELISPDNDGGCIPACTVCDYIGWEDSPHTALVPSYSTDLAAAFEVVEKMREQGINTHIESYFGGYTVEIPDGYGGLLVSLETERIDDLPRCICLAAREAVEKAE